MSDATGIRNCRDHGHGVLRKIESESGDNVAMQCSQCLTFWPLDHCSFCGRYGMMRERIGRPFKRTWFCSNVCKTSYVKRGHRKSGA